MTLFELAALLDVEHNAAFVPFGGRTWCNAYTSVFCGARGVRLPPVVADEQFTYLASSLDWQRVPKAEAVTRANAHELVVAAVQALPHGHIAPCVESPSEGPSGLYVSAAGAHNFIRAKLERSFGFLQPVFFHHVGP